MCIVNKPLKLDSPRFRRIVQHLSFWQMKFDVTLRFYMPQTYTILITDRQVVDALYIELKSMTLSDLERRKLHVK